MSDHNCEDRFGKFKCIHEALIHFADMHNGLVDEMNDKFRNLNDRVKKLERGAGIKESCCPDRHP